MGHGATGKGNDQVRFELRIMRSIRSIKIIAPWREWDLTSRTKLLEFAEANQIPIAKDKRERRRSASTPTSCIPRPREKSWKIRRSRDEIVYQRTIRPEDAPDEPRSSRSTSSTGIPTAIDGAPCRRPAR